MYFYVFCNEIMYFHSLLEELRIVRRVEGIPYFDMPHEYGDLCASDLCYELSGEVKH